MGQMTIGSLLEIIDKLKENYSEEQIKNLPIYIGGDDELNSIHTCFFSQLLNFEDDEDVDYFEMINERSANCPAEGLAFLIS